MNRRNFLTTATALSGFAAIARPASAQDAEIAVEPAAESQPFGFEDVARIAQAAAGEAYDPPRSTLTGSFAELNYDQYRGIRFRRDSDPWAGHPEFALDLLAPGLIFHEPVALNLVENGVARALPFDARMFEFQENLFPDGVDFDTIGDMGWSGFRLRTPLNRPDVMDEVAVFQGASYFRAVSRGTQYGLSARGLAIGTGSQQGEEFPIFRSFWITQPGETDRSVTVYAHLDSRSVSGAYEFVIEPGAETVFRTRSALFPRVELADIGIAPLTSMYWFGPADRAQIDDYRPAVHDSDGLQMLTGEDQRIWRVLSAHERLQISAFQDNDPRGFGLVQRSRDFEEYQDAEARYDLRPSAWIEPNGSWGRGAVSLVEIPVENEFNDNIVSFWRPSEPMQPGERHDFAYDLIFSDLPPDNAPLARVLATRSGTSINDPEARSYVIDFSLDLFTTGDPEPDVRATTGEVRNVHWLRLPYQSRLRLAFEFVPDGDKLADISARLNGPEGQLSESWFMRWTQD
ncbi:glucan biosynthesis protein [Paracoccus tegillarcae]|uniref:Glucans biosynthesis protein G n=1 Tax=Paracoccus tegillarcae TaxID=1529068 RepID=A0A2K9ET70_9RHOB|nr:glucan biosynthesis protein [Paracoccus tegillarcae]AUH34945.1 glucan biosynthesis protein G [Paracoccus tegillarcae]